MVTHHRVLEPSERAMAAALEDAPVLKREPTTSESSFKKIDEEKAAADVVENQVGLGDDESEVDSTIIEKSEDVAIKVRARSREEIVRVLIGCHSPSGHLCG